MRYNALVFRHLPVLIRFSVTIDSSCHRLKHRGTYKYLPIIGSPPGSKRLQVVLSLSSVSALPSSHPDQRIQCGRFIGRHNLDLAPFWTAHDLENKLHSFKDFYNDQRCHYALDGDTPGERTSKIRPKVADLDSFRWQSHCRGLYQLPVAA